jgi:hypothetical protein
MGTRVEPLQYPVEDWIYDAYESTQVPVDRRGPFYRENLIFTLGKALTALEAPSLNVGDRMRVNGELIEITKVEAWPDGTKVLQMKRVTG